MTTINYRTVADVARDLGCSLETIRRRCASGALPAVRVGRMWYVLPADNVGAVATEPTAILPVDTTSQPDDAPLMVFDMTGPARQVDAVTATADALRLALNEVTADRDRLQAQLDAGTLAMSERDALKAQVTVLAMRVDALTLMRDQTAQEHERTVDALQSLVASQSATIASSSHASSSHSSTSHDHRCHRVRTESTSKTDQP